MSVALALVQAALLLLLLGLWPRNWAICYIVRQVATVGVTESLPVSLCHGPGPWMLSLRLLSSLDIF